LFRLTRIIPPLQGITPVDAHSKIYSQPGHIFPGYIGSKCSRDLVLFTRVTTEKWAFKSLIIFKNTVHLVKQIIGKVIFLEHPDGVTGEIVLILPRVASRLGEGGPKQDPFDSL